MTVRPHKNSGREVIGTKRPQANEQDAVFSEEADSDSDSGSDLNSGSDLESESESRSQRDYKTTRKIRREGNR